MTGIWMRIVGALAVATGLLALAGLNAQDKPDKFDPAAKIKQLNQTTGIEALNTLLVALSKNEKESKAVIAEAGKMVKDKPADLTYNSAFWIGNLATDQKDYESARTLLKLACRKALDLESADKASRAYEGLLDVYFLEKKYDDVLKEIEAFNKKGLGETNEKFFVMGILLEERRIRALAVKGEMDKAIKMATELSERYEKATMFMRLKGDLLREAEKYDEAEKAYVQVLRALEAAKGEGDDDSGNNKAELRITRYMLSSIYVDMKKIDKAAEQLKLLLKEQPDNPTFNNDLGYIWADHDLNLDESETLIRKAISEQEKTNKLRKERGQEPLDGAAYLDSLAWVLYKKKKFPEAKKEILEAMKFKESQHVEILDHLAEIHMALGEKDDAIKVWEKALKIDSDTKRDKKRKTEIEAKMKKVAGGAAEPKAEDKPKVEEKKADK